MFLRIGLVNLLAPTAEAEQYINVSATLVQLRIAPQNPKTPEIN